MNKEITGDLRAIFKDFLGHWDIPKGEDLVLTIDHVEEGQAFNTGSKKLESVPLLFFKEVDKPMIVNATNNNTITAVLKNGRVETWKGKKIALFEAVEPRSRDGYAIRIRNYAPKTDEFICADCGQVITDHDGHSAKVIANRALSKFNEYLCFDCALKRKGTEDAAD